MFYIVARERNTHLQSIFKSNERVVFKSNERVVILFSLLKMWIVLLFIGCVTAATTTPTNELTLNPCRSIPSRVAVNGHTTKKTFAVRASIHTLCLMLGDANDQWEYFYGGYFAMLAPTVPANLEHLKIDLQIFHIYAAEFQLTTEAEFIRRLRCEVEDISRRRHRMLNVNVFISKIIKPTMDALQIVICKQSIINKLIRYLQTVDLNILHNVKPIGKTHKYVDMIKKQIKFLNINM